MRVFSAFTAVSLFALSAGSALGAPSVLVTIKPLHALVAGVMEGVGEPGLLIEGAASPHGFSLRPSDAQKLARAEIVFWIGEDMEAFLTGPLETLAGDAEAFAMMDVGGMAIPPLRKGGLFEAHAHDHHDEDHDGHHEDHHHSEDHDHDDHDHDHDHDEHHHADEAAEGGHAHARDAHIWLDPRNARLMVAAITGVLMDADPANAAAYDANGAALSERLALLEEEIAERIEPVAGTPFFVFHDAYHAYEARFGIPATGSFTVNPEIAPGARRLSEIRARVDEFETACLFAEPQFSPQVIETVAAETGARVGILDGLGADVDAGPEAYFTLLNQLTDNLVDCLDGGTAP